MSPFKESYHHLKNSNIINVHTLKNPTVPSPRLRPGVGLVGLIASVGAAARPPELQVSFQRLSVNT